jgi:hypothetical protein
MRAAKRIGLNQSDKIQPAQKIDSRSETFCANMGWIFWRDRLRIAFGPDVYFYLHPQPKRSADSLPDWDSRLT